PTSLLRFAGVALTSIAGLSAAHTVLAQDNKNVDLWIATPADLTLGTLQQIPAPDPALTSVEQGKPNLDQAFDEFDEWRLDKRRAALQDTEFLINLRTFYFDRSDFTGREKQAVAFGGWAG